MNLYKEQNKNSSLRIYIVWGLTD